MATCTNCHHVAQAAFVRPGAVIICDECGQTVRIDAEHIERQVMLPSETQVNNPLALGLPVEAPKAAAGAREATSATFGATSASTEAAAAPEPAAATQAAPSRPISEPTPPDFDEEDQSRIIRPRPRRKHTSITMILLSVVVLIAAGMVITFIIMTITGKTGADPVAPRTQSSAPPTTPATQTPPTRPVPLTPPEPVDNTPAWTRADLPEVPAVALPTVTWQEASYPFEPVPQGGALRLTDVQATSVAFQGMVVTSTQEPVASAVAKIILYDKDRMVYATAEVPLLLIQYLEPQQVHVELPKSVREKVSGASWSMQMGPRVEGGVRLSDTDATATIRNDQQLVRLRATNTSENSLYRVVLALRAFDEQGHVLRTYRIDLPGPIAPEERLEIIAVVPDDARVTADAWRLDAAGSVYK